MCEQTHGFDQGLRRQQPVKWVSVVHLQLSVKAHRAVCVSISRSKATPHPETFGGKSKYLSKSMRIGTAADLFGYLEYFKKYL